MTDYYPPPAQRKRPKHLSLAASNPAPLNEFGATIEEREERIFRSALYFSIIRFGVPNGSECATTNTFPKALALASGNDRTLIYCVNSEGTSFCVPKKDYPKYAELWLRRIAQV